MDAQQPNKDYKIKTRTPVRLIVGLTLFGVLLLGSIIGLTLYFLISFDEARLRGVVVDKQFIAEPERRIILGERGLITRDRSGDHIITVEVRREGEEPQRFNVWLDEESFNLISIGDTFDVGPFLVREPPDAPSDEPVALPEGALD